MHTITEIPKIIWTSLHDGTQFYIFTAANDIAGDAGGHKIQNIPNCVMKLLIHFQTSTIKLLKFGNGYVISSHSLCGIWLFIHTGIEVKPY